MVRVEGAEGHLPSSARLRSRLFGNWLRVIGSLRPSCSALLMSSRTSYCSRTKNCTQAGAARLSLINTRTQNAYYDRKDTCSYVHLHTHTPKAHRRSFTSLGGRKMEGSEEAVSEAHVQGLKLITFTSHNFFRFTGHEPVFSIWNATSHENSFGGLIRINSLIVIEVGKNK